MSWDPWEEVKDFTGINDWGDLGQAFGTMGFSVGKNIYEDVSGIKDLEAAQRQAALAEKDALLLDESMLNMDTAYLNALFGNTDYDYTLGLPQATTTTITPDNPDHRAIFPYLDWNPDGTYNYTEEPDLSGDLKYYGLYDQDFTTDFAKQNAAQREATFGGMYDDIMSYYNNETQRQYDYKNADVRAMIASRNLSGSTVGQSILDRLGEIQDQQEAENVRYATDFTDRARRADTDLKNSLISDLEAGADLSNLIESAKAGFENNVNVNLSEARARDLTNLFAAMDQLYGQSQFVENYNRGVQTGSSNLVTPGSGSVYSGTVVN